MRLAPFLPALALLAACDSSPKIEANNAKPSEVMAKMREAKTASFVNPGKWQQTATVLEIDAPGMPPEIARGMKQATGQAQVHETCLSPEQAKNPREDFFSGADKNCRYEHFTWGDGKVDLKLLCIHPQATQTMALTGDYAPDHYTMAMVATTKGKSPAESMTMKMKVDAKRVGECDAKGAG